MLVLLGLGFSWAFSTKSDTHWMRLSGIWESGVFDRYIPRYMTHVGGLFGLGLFLLFLSTPQHSVQHITK